MTDSQNNSSKILEGLNDVQKKAVLATEGPVLVVAGAGAGKTKTIAHRIAHLIEKGTKPTAILAITFTNKAAAEMRERVHVVSQKVQGLKPEDGQPFVSTFHALGAFIIKENARHLGLTKYFSILDRDESLSLIKQAMREQDINPQEIEPRKILSVISRTKGEGHALSQFQAKDNYFESLVGNLWRRYEELARERQALDFDDLLLKILELWKRYPEILAEYQTRWKYIHIDEYQDTNTIQYTIAKMLANKHQNICVVGDIDQSIYSWRGADFRNLLNFEKDYPQATVITLEQNYRSTKTIIAAANQVITKNRARREKNLFTENEDGERIRLTIGIDENEEAQRIAEASSQLIKKGSRPQDIAVLYRANFQSRALEEAFLFNGIPYKVLGTRFFERKEIIDVLCYLKAALNPQDIESVKRVINIPPRGIGKVTIAKVFSNQVDTLSAKVAAQVRDFQEILTDIKRAADEQPPSIVIKYILTRSGLEQMLRDGSDEDRERLENIRELVTLALKYDALSQEEGIWQFLTEVALASDQDSMEKKDDSVRLMTVHAAKGLEFDYVFIAGLEQDLFPHKGMDREEKRDDEEERRLFYVALTRARKKLFLSYAQIRTIFGSRQINMPSQFLGEIHDSLLETDPQTDSYSGGSGSNTGYLIDF
jgi:DNA helicase-2/ATP-dependent DNA helicase PcrA